MKNLKNALGMGVLFFILIFTACNPNSGGAGGGGPVTPNTTPAKITTSVVAPTTGLITLDGSGVGTKAIVDVTSTGNPAPAVAVDGVPFSGNQYTSPDIFESRDIVFTASNTAGADTKKVSVQVTIDPIFAKIVGNSISGKTWLLIDQTKQPISGGPAVSFMTDCYRDDKYTFRPNLKGIVDFGNDQSCTFKGKDSANYKFNKSTMILQFLPEQETNLPMEVSFPAPNQMRLRHERDSYIWVRLFQEI